MNRRQVLFGAVSGLAATAGCLQTGSVGSSADRTESGTGTGTERTGTAAGTTRDSVGYRSFLVRSRYDEPQATLVIGNRSQPRSRYRGAKPHEAVVWNDATTTRTIAVAFAGRRERYALKPDAYLWVYVAKPGELVVSLPGEGGGRKKTVRVPPRLIDCNDSKTEVAVGENGTMRTMGTSAAAGCGVVTPTPATESGPSSQTENGSPQPTTNA